MTLIESINFYIYITYFITLIIYIKTQVKMSEKSQKCISLERLSKRKIDKHTLEVMEMEQGKLIIS